MTKEIDLSIDGKIIYKLLSLEFALRTSVLHPLFVHPRLYEAGKLYSPLSFISFWAEEVKDYGENHVRHRIDVASDDIKVAVSFHEFMIDKFNELNKRFRTKNRGEISEEIRSLAYEVDDYLNFISIHQKKVLDDFFLYFPTCYQSRMTSINSYFLELSFNPQQTEDGAREEIKNLLELENLFFMQKGKLEPNNFIPQIRDSMPSREYSDNVFSLKQKLEDFFDFSI